MWEEKVEFQICILSSSKYVLLFIKSDNTERNGCDRKGVEIAPLDILPMRIQQDIQMEIPNQHLEIQRQSTGDGMCWRYRFESHLCKVTVEAMNVDKETRETLYKQLLRILKMSNSTMRYGSKKLILVKVKKKLLQSFALFLLSDLILQQLPSLFFQEKYSCLLFYFGPLE